MNLTPIALKNGGVIQLATYGSPSVSPLPNNGQLITLPDNTMITSIDGRVEVLPPEQTSSANNPEGAYTMPTVLNRLKDGTGAAKLWYLPISGLLATAITGLTILGGLLLTNISPPGPSRLQPVIDSAQGSGGDLESRISSDQTPTATPAPTYTPTATPTPRPTATPIPDPLGIKQLIGTEVTHVSQIQHIIDYLEQALLGRNVVGHTVPVNFQNREQLEAKVLTAVSKNQVDANKTTAFTSYIFPANTRSGLKAEAVYILSGRPFEEAIGDVGNEITKPYALELNRSVTIAEGGGMIADVGVDQLLRKASNGSVDVYRPLKSMLSPARARAHAKYYLTDPKVSGNVFVDAYRIAWLTAKDTGIGERMASRPDGRPTLEETQIMFNHLIEQREAEMVRRVNAGELLPYSSLVETIAAKRIGLNARPTTRENTETVARYFARFTAP